MNRLRTLGARLGLLLPLMALLAASADARQRDDVAGLRDQLRPRYDIVALQGGVGLVPRTPNRDIRLIEVRDGARWLSPAGLKEVAAFAAGIAPHKALLDGRAGVVQSAHGAGLTVTPYTFSSRAPSRFPDVRDEMRYYLADLGVDALFTDNPDRFPR